MKRKNFLLLLVFITLLGSFVSNAKSTTEIITRNLIEECFDSSIPDKIVNETDNQIVLEDEQSIVVINKNALKETNLDTIPNQLRTPGNLYSVEKLKDLGRVVMAKELQILSGEPGIKLNLAISESVSAGITGTFGASKSDISAAVGFNVSGSKTVTYGGYYNVPKRHDGKKVKRVELIAKPLCKKVKYAVYLKTKYGMTKKVLRGKGYAYYPVGIHYTKKFYY